MTRNFRELLEAKWAKGKFVCIGLDSEFAKIPGAPDLSDGDVWESLNSLKGVIVDFNRAIVSHTCDLVCAYKPNFAFYEALGGNGLLALEQTIDHIHRIAPTVPVILDAKRADIGNTNIGSVTGAFDLLRADAITVHPYLGAEALKPFLDRDDKGVFVLCRTSNPGAGEFQDLQVDSKPLYQHVAQHVADGWNANGNCGLVVGATYPDELRQVRAIVGDMPILIPGVGAQGGDLEKTIAAGKNSRSQGMIINSSRGIIFASSGDDFAEAARRETLKLHEAITKILHPN